jgi:hypothetical protein
MPPPAAEREPIAKSIAEQAEYIRHWSNTALIVDVIERFFKNNPSGL